MTAVAHETERGQDECEEPTVPQLLRQPAHDVEHGQDEKGAVPVPQQAISMEEVEDGDEGPAGLL